MNNEWAAETDVDTNDDDRATARSYKSRHNAAAETWEDVRYLYEESKQAGRKAARELLQQRYEFITVDEEDTLYVYNEDTGLFSDELGRVHAEIFDGLDPGGHWTRHEKNEVVAGLKQTNVVQKRELNAGGRDAPLRCVANGVLDVVERELHEHSPEYRFTRRVPVEYDPEASTEPYREFVDRMVEREADREALFEMVGHTLLPGANDRHRLFLILTGGTTNGKSEFFKRVRALLNGPDRTERNTASVKMSKLAQNRFSQHAIYGSLANIAGEIDGKKIRNTANFKDVTGGDEVELEPKGQESFFDTVDSTQMFAANDPPILGERDKEAIAERIVPIELPYKFVEKPDGPMEKEKIPKRELETDLETPEALSGFLNLALAGIGRLEEQNDVSLPECPAERLQMYEETADPMREFGERCLQNDPDDYLVKADVTTLYKQFAADRGDEISQNVSSTLHDVLRGAPDLNYTDSRPESPDYSDTDLPLRGWGERKRVVERVTLTEEGLEYAEAAGLVDAAAGEADEPDVLTPGGVTPDVAGNTGRVPAVRGEVAAEYEDRYGNDIITLRGDDGTEIDVRAEGAELPRTGEVVRVVGARLDTDELGAVELVVRPTTDVVVERDETTADDGPDPDQTTVDRAETAADGGVAVEGDLKRVADALRESGATAPGTAVGVATVFATSPATKIGDGDRVEELLEKGARAGRFADTGDGGYYLLSG